jgi:hypothetical protein
MNTGNVTGARADYGMGSSNGTYLGEFKTERKLTAPSAIKESEIFWVGLTRLRLGGV